MTLQYLITIANSSGGILYFMMILLFVAIVIIVERLKHLADMRRVGYELINLCQSKGAIQLESLQALQKNHEDYPIIQLLKTVIGKDIKDLNREALDGNLEEAIMLEVPHLDKGVWILDTIITLAPLLGLFGTIVGMFNAMAFITDIQNSAVQISGGISEALISTAFGLVIAMVGLSFFNNINYKIRFLVHQMETFKVMVLNRSEEFKNINPL
ncbi:MotA/TolQ/ExbB proton channel family protein [Polynucleobacter kasalickyi]|uniref:Outer membrane transport energization protein ExbB n=1 Tax=Polynucleobacter kasalickyi TaxID=1938817 RepID=A0A1W1YJ14_9BURK|nr:MotA/TolQ/ExbB proton channel family protein [Polynucleobacter kasalickyi]SMC36220.1 outer membrane transport energization protein ExbB [Polynucleobacter kasalickyi]